MVEKVPFSRHFGKCTKKCSSAPTRISDHRVCTNNVSHDSTMLLAMFCGLQTTDKNGAHRFTRPFRTPFSRENPPFRTLFSRSLFARKLPSRTLFAPPPLPFPCKPPSLHALAQTFYNHADVYSNYLAPCLSLKTFFLCATSSCCSMRLPRSPMSKLVILSTCPIEKRDI